MLGKDWVIDAAYLGNIGHNIIERIDANAAKFDYTGTIPLINRQKYPGETVLQSTGIGWSSYNGGTLRVEKKVSVGMYFLGAYTYSHALNFGALGTPSVASRDFKQLDKENAENDVRHRVTASYLYELPFGHNRKFLGGASGVVDRLVGGWKINGITTWSTGQYFSWGPSLAYDNLNIGGWSLSLPDLVGNPYPAHQSYKNWWNINAFAAPGCPTAVICPTAIHRPGTVRRNEFLLPGTSNSDLSFLKDTRINERATVQFRAELFNAFNHTQFGGYGLANLGGVDPDWYLTVNGGTALNSDFGVIHSTKIPAREVQFALKLIW
jgi:hypothetical protein